MRAVGDVSRGTAAAVGEEERRRRDAKRYVRERTMLVDVSYSPGSGGPVVH